MKPGERCKDLVGKKVRLVEELSTVGGNVFTKGTEMRVSSTYRGRYGLCSLHDGDPSRTDISQVSRRKFQVIE